MQDQHVATSSCFEKNVEQTFILFFFEMSYGQVYVERRAMAIGTWLYLPTSIDVPQSVVKYSISCLWPSAAEITNVASRLRLVIFFLTFPAFPDVFNGEPRILVRLQP